VEKATSGLALPFKIQQILFHRTRTTHSAQRAAPLSTHTANRWPLQISRRSNYNDGSPVGISSNKSAAPSLPVCVILSSSAQRGSDTTCCNYQCGKHNYHKTNNTNANRKDTSIYVVHPNVGLRPPSIGIGYLIIQLMEITDKLTPLRHTHSLYGHTNL
jgi:hypothetical protein